MLKLDTKIKEYVLNLHFYRIKNKRIIGEIELSS